MAAVAYFLKLDGIVGESTDARHPGEIELESFSWGETESVAAGGGGGGGGAGKVQIEDLHVVMRQSKASPPLFLACASGQHVKTAVLTGRKAGKAPMEFLSIKLTDVVVSSYRTGGGTAGSPTTRSRSTSRRSRSPSRRRSPTGRRTSRSRRAGTSRRT